MTQIANASKITEPLLKKDIKDLVSKKVGYAMYRQLGSILKENPKR